MKKILITGGAGFIGSNLAKKLIKENNEVTVMDNFYTGNKRNISKLLENPNFTFVLHDVTNPIEGYFDEIYNLACPASPIHYQLNPIKTAKTSILGIINILDLASKTKAKVLHASTSEIYGNPLEHPQNERYFGNVNTLGPRSCYDESKRMTETFCSDYYNDQKVDIRITRIFNTYGPNMTKNDGRVISNFINQALLNKDITLYGEGTQTRCFQYIDDLLDAMTTYMNLNQNDLISNFRKLNWFNVPLLNIGNSKEITMFELADEVLKLIPYSKSKITYLSLPKDDPERRKPDISTSKNILGWEPKVTLEEGLNEPLRPKGRSIC